MRRRQGFIWNGPDRDRAHVCAERSAAEWDRLYGLRLDQQRNPEQTHKCLTDIANGQLASVSWVIPTGQASDHPAINDGTGPSWVASVVNAIGNSQYWSNTAIIITWDDWGGWYDHVPHRPPSSTPMNMVSACP